LEATCAGASGVGERGIAEGGGDAADGAMFGLVLRDRCGLGACRGAEQRRGSEGERCRQENFSERFGAGAAILILHDGRAERRGRLENNEWTGSHIYTFDNRNILLAFPWQT
jgi:hypothetical protein